MEGSGNIDGFQRGTGEGGAVLDFDQFPTIDYSAFHLKLRSVYFGSAFSVCTNRPHFLTRSAALEIPENDVCWKSRKLL